MPGLEVGKGLAALELLQTSFGVHRSNHGYEPASVTPTRRKIARRLLTKYVRPAHSLARRIAEFEEAHFRGRLVIAVH